MRGVMEAYGQDRFPFEVVCGTSAGAINAVFMAANAHRPREGIETLYRAWRGITASDVYDPRWRAVLGNLLRILTTPFRSSTRCSATRRIFAYRSSVTCARRALTMTLGLAGSGAGSMG